MKFQHNDGDRAEADYRGTTGDCVTRAIAIATGKPYQEPMPPEPSVYCAWCKAHISGPQEPDQNKVSHGICKKCKGEQDKEVEKLRMERKG